MAFEASEVGATHKARSLVPVRPAEPLAGAPDRGPIPLADSVTAGAAAVGASGGPGQGRGGQRRPAGRVGRPGPPAAPGPGQAQGHRRDVAHGDAASGGDGAARPHRRRRRARRRRLRVRRAPADTRGRSSRSRRPSRRSRRRRRRWPPSAGPGVDLITDDPRRALELLNAAYAKLDEAEDAGYPAGQIDAAARRGARGPRPAVRRQARSRSTAVFTFPAEKPPSSRRSSAGRTVRPTSSTARTRPCGASTSSKKNATAILKNGHEGVGHQGRGAEAADDRRPRRPGPGQQEQPLALAAVEQPTARGPSSGSRSRTRPRGATTSRASSTFVANFDAAFYKLYVVDPSEQNIMVFSPANDGSGYPGNGRPATAHRARRLDGITDLLHRRRHLRRRGRRRGARDPGIGLGASRARGHLGPAQPGLHDDLVAGPPDGSSSRRNGVAVRLRRPNHRIVAFNKANGKYIEQYRPADGDQALGRPPGVRRAARRRRRGPRRPMWWISHHRAPQRRPRRAAEGPAATPTPAPTRNARPDHEPDATPKPTKTPKP